MLTDIVKTGLNMTWKREERVDKEMINDTDQKSLESMFKVDNEYDNSLKNALK